MSTPSRISPTSTQQVSPSTGTYSPQPFRTQNPPDTLTSAQESQICCGCSLFSSAWQCLVGIFRYFFPQSSQPQLETPNEPNSITRDPLPQTDNLNVTNIARIAREERRFWFTNTSGSDTPSGTGPFLSNSYLYPITLWGMEYANAEIAFQASKFRHEDDGVDICSRFQYLVTSRSAIAFANAATRTWSEQKKQDWNARQLDAMREIVHAKFSQHPQLKEWLLATGDAYLEYRVDYLTHPEECEFWGHAARGGWGENWLGKILVETRVSLGGLPSIARRQLPIPTLSLI